MNIDEAKNEVKNAVKAYLLKDEAGQYEIPVEKQRPILLMGPPGIGKTAVMEQIAHELGIGLVSYTITHHTRQSAIGLPKISEKSYGGKEYSVTEYTMSEIIGAVYEQIEKSKVKEGILFLDEINCVSETLAPTMLQFLQYKTFGSHKLPEGYIIVTAGNPPQYNKSVRDFDIVTLDRVRQINIDEDFDAWKEYAYKAGVHGSILSYLEIKKDNFYSIKTDVNGRSFVTARGWEDLSRIIKVNEKLGIEVNENLTSQYLQNTEIARDFADYYELYRRYNELYKIPDILEGRFPENKEALRKGSFDEKLSILGLLTDKLMDEFRDYAKDQAVQKILFEKIKEMASGSAGAADFGAATKEMESALDSEVAAGMISRDDEKVRRLAIGLIRELDGTDVASAKKWFTEREDARQARI
nr:AAA family ATPase [Butyrivibrio sp.]